MEGTFVLSPFPLSVTQNADWMAGTLAAILEHEVVLSMAPRARIQSRKKNAGPLLTMGLLYHFWMAFIHTFYVRENVLLPCISHCFLTFHMEPRSNLTYIRYLFCMCAFIFNFCCFTFILLFTLFSMLSYFRWIRSHSLDINPQLSHIKF